MNTYRVVWKNGSFKPKEPISLPELWEGDISVPDELSCDENTLTKVYELLSARFNTGDRDAAERHDEHHS